LTRKSIKMLPVKKQNQLPPTMILQ